MFVLSSFSYTVAWLNGVLFSCLHCMDRGDITRIVGKFIQVASGPSRDSRHYELTSAWYFDLHYCPFAAFTTEVQYCASPNILTGQSISENY